LAIGACAAHWQATRLHEFAPWLQLGFAGAWLLFSVRALAEVRSANAAWWLASGSHAFLVAGLAFNAEVGWRPSLLYLAGVGLSALLGHLALARLRRLEGLDRLEIHDYQGHCYEHPKLNLAMLLAMLGVLVSPITTAFIGLELLYARIDTGQYLLLGLATLGFLVNNLATIRIYAKAFLGPHVKTYHEAARRST
jgi:NADH:ubiquinone oxidoreductase subunit 2 (subunit N)